MTTPSLTTLKSHLTSAATATRSTLTRGSRVAWTATAKQLRRLGVWLSGVGPGGLSREQMRLLKDVLEGVNKYNTSFGQEGPLLTVDNIVAHLVRDADERRADGVVAFSLGRIEIKQAKPSVSVRVSKSTVPPIPAQATHSQDRRQCQFTAYGPDYQEQDQ